MNTIHRIFLSLLVLYAVQSIASIPSERIEVGYKVVSIPAPVGFHEISELSPKTRELAESITPPHHRLLAAFVSDNDFQLITKGESPEMERYILLQVNRKLENLSVSDAQFSQLADEIKHEQHKLREKTKDKTDPWLNALTSNVSEKLSTEHGFLMNLAVGEPVPLGIFLEQDAAVGSAQLVKLQFSIEGEKIDYLVVGGVSFIKVGDKVLEAYVNSKYEAQSDLEWVRTTSSTWVGQILEANLSQRPRHQTPIHDTDTQLSIWDGVIKEMSSAAKGSIVLGLLVGLVILIIGVLKMAFWKKKP